MLEYLCVKPAKDMYTCFGFKSFFFLPDLLLTIRISIRVSLGKFVIFFWLNANIKFFLAKANNM